MEAKHRTSAVRTDPAGPSSQDMTQPTNALQSNFEETASMDSDERYLVRATWTE